MWCMWAGRKWRQLSKIMIHDHLGGPAQPSRKGKDFSYARSYDSRLRQWVIRGAENLTGKRILQALYDQLHAENPGPTEVWGRALELMRVGVEFDEGQLTRVPAKGAVIFLANHPFGVVDGLILCHLMTLVRHDYFLMINEVLADQPLVEGHLLPIDFRNTREAVQTNIQTKKMAAERLKKGEVLGIFPSGGIATARRVFGTATELPWHRTVCALIHQARCAVVPLFFHGQNSRLFHLVSLFSMDLRLGLLLHEAVNKRGRTFRVAIGDPIAYESMCGYGKRKDLIDFLHESTLRLRH